MCDYWIIINDEWWPLWLNITRKYFGEGFYLQIPENIQESWTVSSQFISGDDILKKLLMNFSKDDNIYILHSQYWED